MDYLLDTHALIWWLSNPKMLKEAARAVIADPRHTVSVSIASIWEIGIKTSLGKLDVPDDLDEQLRIHRFEVMPITIRHVKSMKQLPWHHRDPFDRMLVAQAQVEGCAIVTRDKKLMLYDISTEHA